MSKKAVDLLQQLSLLTKQGKPVDLARISEAEISKKLEHYFNARSESGLQESQRVSASQGREAAFLSSISAGNSVEDVCPKLLVERFLVMDDPVFRFAMPPNQISKAARAALGMEPESIDIDQLSRKLKFFSQVIPLISSGLLHVLPISLLYRPPESIPIFASENRYRDLVPEKAYEFIRKSAVVNGLERTPQGFHILDGPNVSRKSTISVTFKNDEPTERGSIFQLQPIDSKNTETGEFEIRLASADDTPVEETQYQVWEEESVNRAVGQRLGDIAKEIHLADALGVSYLTNSTFEAELLSRSGGSSEVNAAVGFLEANKGLLDISNPLLITKLRTENEVLFGQFRAGLIHVSDELKGVSEGDFSERARRLFLREIEPQIHEINALSRKVLEALAQSSLQMGGTLLLGMLTGPSLPVASLLGISVTGVIAGALPAFGDYQRGRNRPEFIWNRLKM